MKNILATVTIVLIALFGYHALYQAPVTNTTVAKQSAYERVMQKRTLRCGHATNPPFISINDKGDIEGAYGAIMRDVAARLGLKLEWEETGYGEIPAGFQTGRYDMFCGNLWATTIRASTILFSDPVYYDPAYACVGANTTEYDQDVMKLNAPDKIFSVYDNDVSSQMASVIFPQAKQLAVPPLASMAEWFEQIGSGKADAIATCDKVISSDYMKNNPGKIKLLDNGPPLTYIRVVLGLPQGETQLKAMIDQALYEMVADGSLNRHLKEALGENFKYIVTRAYK